MLLPKQQEHSCIKIVKTCKVKAPRDDQIHCTICLTTGKFDIYCNI